MDGPSVPRAVDWSVNQCFILCSDIRLYLHWNRASGVALFMLNKHLLPEAVILWVTQTTPSATLDLPLQHQWWKINSCLFSSNKIKIKIWNGKITSQCYGGHHKEVQFIDQILLGYAVAITSRVRYIIVRCSRWGLCKSATKCVCKKNRAKALWSHSTAIHK